jgi:hypothetical protein
MVALLFLAAVLALQAWAWVRLSAHVMAGVLTKPGATARYSLWALVPLLLFLSVLAGAVGLEEWMGLALLSESLARATPLIAAFLLGMAGVGSLCFGVRCAFIKPATPGAA